jgi:hypothetical protein
MPIEPLASSRADQRHAPACHPASAPLGWTRVAIAGYTLVALGGIGFTAWRSFDRHSYGSAAVPHDFDTRADRHRFLGFASMLLSGASFVGVVYVGLAAAFVETCR